MRNGYRLLTGALLGLVALAGGAAAQSANGACDLATDKASALCETGANVNDRYYDADASAATEHASGLVDADASHSEADQEATLFGWLSLRWSAFVDKLGDVFSLAGEEAPDADGGVDVYASENGVDLDATVGDVTFDGSPLGDLDGETFEAAATVHATQGQAEAKVGAARSDVEAKVHGLVG